MVYRIFRIYFDKLPSDLQSLFIFPRIMQSDRFPVHALHLRRICNLLNCLIDLRILCASVLRIVLILDCLLSAGGFLGKFINRIGKRLKPFLGILEELLICRQLIIKGRSQQIQNFIKSIVPDQIPV